MHVSVCVPCFSLNLSLDKCRLQCGRPGGGWLRRGLSGTAIFKSQGNESLPRPRRSPGVAGRGSGSSQALSHIGGLFWEPGLDQEHGTAFCSGSCL